MTDSEPAPEDLSSKLLFPGVAAEVPEVVHDGTESDEAHPEPEAPAPEAPEPVAPEPEAPEPVAPEPEHLDVEEPIVHAQGPAPVPPPPRRPVARVAGLARERPLGLAFTGACAGFLAGMLLPTTSLDERLAPYAGRIADRTREAGHTAFERGKHAVQAAEPRMGVPREAPAAASRPG